MAPIVTVTLILFIVLSRGPYCDRHFDPVYCALSIIVAHIVTVTLILFFFILIMILMSIKIYVLFIIPNRASQLRLGVQILHMQ